MKNPTITVTTTNSIYFLSEDEYLIATQNGILNHIGAEEILSVEEELKVDWRKIGF
tara:strand:+ start:22880 stop:23047 length:168 start_codon:yes stop_codon:yes gene_type:complete